METVACKDGDKREVVFNFVFHYHFVSEVKEAEVPLPKSLGIVFSPFNLHMVVSSTVILKEVNGVKQNCCVIILLKLFKGNVLC